MRIDLRTAEPDNAGIDEDTGEPYFTAYDPDDEAVVADSVDVTEEQYRVICQYSAARERRAAAEQWVEARRALPEPPQEPEPDEIPAGGKLTARQEAFCQRYAAQPVATHAAALAGYAEASLRNQAYRLLRNPLVLDRVASIRAERNVRYVLEPDTLHDKLEALFFDAIADRNHTAAIAALRLQAGLGGLLTRRAGGAGANDAPPEAEMTEAKPQRRRRGSSARTRAKRTRMTTK